VTSTDLDSSQLGGVLSVAASAAREAGHFLRGVHPTITREKSSGNLVTAADLESERMIVERIRGEFPEHAILSEESLADVSLEAENLWIVDPLDGTNNFAHGIPQFCVAIAFARQGTVRAGAVYDPNRDELFTAAAGLPSQCNGQPMAVSPRDRLEQSIICTGFYYDRGDLMRRTLDSIETLFVRGVRGVRRFGSAALDLCWVACGRLDGYFEYQLGPWDYAAGHFLVQQSGGRCCDRSGQPLTLSTRGVIASNGRIHEELLDRVRWRESSPGGVRDE
jgi:myo-inositol-1(or 4)-monophosphatase